MACKACPFACTEESEQVQQYGCLPTPSDFIRIKHDYDLNMSCHENPNKICKGFIGYLTENPQMGLSCTTGSIISNVTWQTRGEVMAIFEAGVLVRESLELENQALRTAIELLTRQY